MTEVVAQIHHSKFLISQLFISVTAKIDMSKCWQVKWGQNPILLWHPRITNTETWAASRFPSPIKEIKSEFQCPGSKKGLSPSLLVLIMTFNSPWKNSILAVIREFMNLLFLSISWYYLIMHNNDLVLKMFR